MRFAIRAVILCLIPFLLQAGCADRDYGERLPTVGRPMPAFDLPMLDGARATSSSVKGTPVLVALWSSNCRASRLALQALASIESDYAARGMRVGTPLMLFSLGSSPGSASGRAIVTS